MTAGAQPPRGAGLFPVGHEIAEPRRSVGFSPTSPAEVTSRPILFPDEGHGLTIAPTGAGKGTSCITPALLTYPGPIIVVDPTGMSAAVTAAYRRSLGHDVCVIDPMGVSGQPVSRFNPLDLIDPTKLDAVDLAKAIAEVLQAREPDGRNAYWNNRATHVVSIGALGVATDERPSRRNLGSLRRLIELLARGTDGGPAAALRRLAASRHPEVRGLSAMFETGETESRATIMQVVLDSIGFISGPQIEASLSRSDFSLDDVTEGKPLTIYLVLPAHMMTSHAPLLRLWLATLFAAIMRRRRRPPVPTLMILDEAAQLGRFAPLLSAITLLRNYGLSCWTFFQDAAQLLSIWGPDAATIRNNCRLVQGFGHQSQITRDDFAAFIGMPNGLAPDEPLPPEQAIVQLDGRVLRAERRDYRTDPTLRARAGPNPFFAEDGPIARPRKSVPRGYLRPVARKPKHKAPDPAERDGQASVLRDPQAVLHLHELIDERLKRRAAKAGGAT